MVGPNPLGDEIAPAATDDATGGKANETELAFWDSITNSEVASDYTAYLERYPTGNFCALARARLIGLAASEVAGHGEEVMLEITYWESAKDSDDQAMIHSYLEKHPDGHFRELAEERLRHLKNTNGGEEPYSQYSR